MANIENLMQYKRIHLIGIGGTSMSGIAEILKNWGFFVTGSDTHASDVTKKLSDTGIKVVIGHEPQMVEKANLVVYSAAIKDTDPELVRARELGIKTVERKVRYAKKTGEQID